ncbi:MAG: ACT domain-containing protein [Terriglobales bacterium]
MKYRVLGEALAVCQLTPDSPIPAWASGSEFFCVARTRDELSIVCTEEVCSNDRQTSDRSQATTRVERGWIALKLEGPFPFSMTGVLASFLQPLAEAQIPIFAISTFRTDYVLIKHNNLKQAIDALAAAGHAKVDGGDE